MFDFTVRTYNALKRAGITVTTQAEAIAAGDMIMRGKIRNTGRRTATELYRAGGLGVYQIAKRIDRHPETIRTLCGYFDKYYK